MFSNRKKPSNSKIVSLNLQDASNEEEEDQIDQIIVHLNSDIIKINFHQFCKYSRLIQKELQNQTSIGTIIASIEQNLQRYRIKEENVKIFFKLLNDERINITSDEYIDLYKLSQIFKVKSLRKLLNNYAKNSTQNLNFVLNLLIEQQSNEVDDLIPFDFISINIENILLNNIEDCLKSDKFGQLPISTVFRIIEKSDKNQIKSDTLYDFIVKSIDERCPLFLFLDIKRLSDEKFDDLCQKNSKRHFDFLKNDFNFLNELKCNKKLLELEVGKLEDNKQQLENLNNQKDSEILKLKMEVADLNKKNKNLELQINKLTDENKKLKQKNEEVKDIVTPKFNKEFSGNHFDGIFNHLSKFYNGNICDKNIISITGNKDDDCKTPISSIIDFDYNGECYYSEDESNSYICFDFKNNYVSVSAYSFKASNQGRPRYLRSWIVEGSNNQNEWTILDNHLNDTQFSSPSQVILFTIQDPSKRNQKFKFIRLKITDKSSCDDYYLDVFNIEFFGSYF